jgi:hypothetical protein
MTYPVLPGPGRAAGSVVIVVLVILAAVVVCLQYTSFALLPAEKTSMLWGLLTGLVVGGLILTWVRSRRY